MREIIFKDLNNIARGQKNVFVAETLESEGILCHSERRTIYLIKEKVHIYDPFNLEEEVKKLQENNVHPRQIFIHKKMDSVKKTKEFTYCLLGRLYVVVGEEIYAIAFKHAFKLSLVDLAHKKDHNHTPTKDKAEA
jgi:hypothetical protein